MLSEKEIQFLAYWESARESESRLSSKIRRGMPMALLFGIPILASVVLVYFISPDWYTKISKSVSRVTITIVIAVLISVFFFAFLRMQVKWEMNEQSYQELKAKLRKSEAADNEKKTS